MSHLTDKDFRDLGPWNSRLLLTTVEALIARHRAEAATEALRDAADEMSARLDTFPQRGRHTRARWAEQWLRDRSARIGGQS